MTGFSRGPHMRDWQHCLSRYIAASVGSATQNVSIADRWLPPETSSYPERTAYLHGTCGVSEGCPRRVNTASGVAQRNTDVDLSHGSAVKYLTIREVDHVLDRGHR
jgi:hypothetical protein